MEYVVIEIVQVPYYEASIKEMGSFIDVDEAFVVRQSLEQNCNYQYCEYRVEVRK